MLVDTVKQKQKRKIGKGNRKKMARVSQWEWLVCHTRKKRQKWAENKCRDFMKLFFLRLHFLFDIERHYTLAHTHTPFDFHRGFIVVPEWEIFRLLLFPKVAEIWYLKVICLRMRERETEREGRERKKA